jgi:hypothetical protein
VLGALLQHEVGKSVASNVVNTPLASHAGTFASSITVGGTPALLQASSPAARPLIHHLAEVSYASGLKTVFLAAAIFAILGAVAGMALVRRKDIYRPGSEAPPGQGGGAGPGRPGGMGAAGPPAAGMAAGAAAGAGAGAGVGAGAGAGAGVGTGPPGSPG